MSNKYLWHGPYPGPVSSLSSLFSSSAKTLYTVVCTAALITSPQLDAQTDGTAIEEVIVTSSRVPIPLRQIGTSVSVMDELEIEARGNQSLTDLLRQMPSVSSNSNGGIGKTTTVRIRGEEGFRTLTYLDGMRLQDPSAPQITTDFSQLLSSGISRIEILRGPQGLAYGADAGGVINISTAQAEEGFSLSIDGQSGEFGSSQLSGDVSGSSGSFDYFLSFTDFETDGFNTRNADVVLMDDDGYENTSFHGRLGAALTDELRIDVVHRDIEGLNEYDGCFDPASFAQVHACSNTYDLQATRIGLDYASESFSHELSYTTTESRRQDYTAGLPTFGNRGEQNRIEYVGSATALPGFDLVFGADRQEDINNDRGRERRRENNGLFLEYLSDFSDALFVTAGIRHDDNDDFGSNTSYRLSGAYLMDLGSGTLKLKSAIGTGFRAPSPFEVGYNRGVSAFPPASLIELMQEESEGWEAGMEYFNGDLHLEAVYFDQDVENAIFFDLTAFSGYLQDIGSSNSKGVELNAEIPLNPSWHLLANYTHNDTERPDGSQRLRRPRDLFNTGLRYRSNDDRFNFNVFYRSQANAIDTGNAALEDFGVTDITASYQISGSLRVYGRIENLFAEDYQEVVDYNTAGRAAYFGINYRLNR